MRGIEIHDRDERVLSFDLEEVLQVLGGAIDCLTWHCSNVEAVGASASALHSLADGGTACTGAELRRISRGITQTIDAEFRGVDSAGKSAILIRAIDSSLWEVFAPDSLLDRLRDGFSDVRPASYEAG